MVAKQVMLAVIGMMTIATCGLADCGHFFKKQVVVQQQVAVPYAVHPPVYYAAGNDIQAEALADKVARLVEQKLAIRQQQQAATPVAVGTFAKCASCHTGPQAAGGLVLDGKTPITCNVYWRWGEIAVLGRNVPQKMKGLMNAMTAEQKGAINEALLNLPRADPVPLPAPEPDGGLQ